MTMRPDERAALRRLAHCGVVRFRFQDDGMSGLNGRGLASATYVSGPGFCFDWRLTAAGRRAAAALGL